jgi:hypothetical protein
VHDGPVLGDVDVIPAEHGLDPVGEPATAGNSHQGVDGLGGDQMLGEVDDQVAGRECETLSPVGLLREGLSQVGRACGYETFEGVPPRGWWRWESCLPQGRVVSADDGAVIGYPPCNTLITARIRRR